MYIHCNFCLNLRIINGDRKENVSGCFFSEHSVSYHVAEKSYDNFSHFWQHWSVTDGQPGQYSLCSADALVRPCALTAHLAVQLHHSLQSSVSSVTSDHVKSITFKSLFSIFEQFILGHPHFIWNSDGIHFSAWYTRCLESLILIFGQV